MEDLDTLVLIEEIIIKRTRTPRTKKKKNLEKRGGQYEGPKVPPIYVPQPCEEQIIINDSERYNYKIYAYPGPDVVDKNSRAEHPPYHVHVISPDIGEIKINIETLEPIVNGDQVKKKVPKHIMKRLRDKQTIYLNVAKQIYHTGRYDESNTDYRPPKSA